MIGRSVGAIAAVSALTANALLIPPGVANIDDSIELKVVNTNWQTVKLPCSECVFSDPRKPLKEAAEGDDLVTIQGGANSLLVNITTLFGGNAIGLKDYPLYPPLASYNKPNVDLIPAESTLMELKDSDEKRVSVKVTADTEFVHEETVAPKGDAVIRIRYQIVSVDNHPITVDAIEVTALKGADSKMAILNAEPVPKANSIFDSLPPQSPNAGKDHKKQCHMPPALCHLREAIEEKVHELQAGLPKKFGGRVGCHGRKGKGQGHRLPSHIRPHITPFEGDESHRPEGHHGKAPKFHGDRPHPHHRPNFAHHHQSGFHTLLKAFFFVLVPIFLGITMGMAVSILGMIVGRLIAFVWIRVVRGGKRGYASVRLDEDDADAAEAAAHDKDDVESVNSEPLPRYEEAPEYTEKESS